MMLLCKHWRLPATAPENVPLIAGMSTWWQVHFLCTSYSAAASFTTSTLSLPSLLIVNRRNFKTARDVENNPGTSLIQQHPQQLLIMRFIWDDSLDSTQWVFICASTPLRQNLAFLNNGRTSTCVWQLHSPQHRVHVVFFHTAAASTRASTTTRTVSLQQSRLM